MATLLLKLVGPMQSWGSTSRFDERDTGKEPTKSGVLGLLAAALGIGRECWQDLKPLTQLKMVIRHDRPGIIKREYQTAGCASPNEIIRADGSKSKDGVISNRYYLADAAFLVGLESEDRPLLESIQLALQNPVWVLSLGRKSYIPSEQIWVNEGVQNASLPELILKWPWISSLRMNEKLPKKLIVSYESDNGEGVFKMDQPLSSYASRCFGARYVKSEWIPFPKEAISVSS